MSERSCPHCGTDNSDHIGVFNLTAGPSDDPIDVEKRICDGCGREYSV